MQFKRLFCQLFLIAALLYVFSSNALAETTTMWGVTIGSDGTNVQFGQQHTPSPNYVSDRYGPPRGPRHWGPPRHHHYPPHHGPRHWGPPRPHHHPPHYRPRHWGPPRPHHHPPHYRPRHW